MEVFYPYFDYIEVSFSQSEDEETSDNESEIDYSSSSSEDYSSEEEDIESDSEDRIVEEQVDKKQKGVVHDRAERKEKEPIEPETEVYSADE